MKDEKNSKKSWDELVFNTIERIAAAPGKLKDNPKESVSAAFDWVKSIRDDVQDKIATDVSERLAQIDWEALTKRVGEHLVQNYDLEVSAKIRFKPKSPSHEREEPRTEDENQKI